MTHSHAGHDHHHASRSEDRRRLAWTLILVATYMVAEFVGGWWTNSLALMADAGHMFSDAGALGLSLFALWIARRPANPRRTYGYYRAEILAALVNAATLIAMSLLIFVEAWQRLSEPSEVQGLPMMAIAAGGLLVNLAALALLHSGSTASLNVRGAWLHVLSDALGSVGAMVAGVVIWWTGWHAFDPLVSVLIGLLVIHSSWRLMQEAVAVLMEGTPGHLNLDEIRDAMLTTDGVLEVHDLHVWSITSGFESLSAHVVVNGQCDYSHVLGELRVLLARQFHIEHVTIQIEPSGFHETPMPV